MYSSHIEAFKKHLRLTDRQRQTLVGILLGDGHLETRNFGRTFRLKIEQSVRHQEYVNHLYEIFGNWVRSFPRVRKVKIPTHQSVNVCFSTLSHTAFRYYGEKFYKNRRKILPDDIKSLLTPRGFAYWYMDDGSIKSSESKGVILNTQSFEFYEVQHLCDVLKSLFDFDCKPFKFKENT